MIGAVIEQSGALPVSLDSVREYLGVGDAVSADLLTELVGAASDLIQGPASLTNTCFTPHILAAAQDEALPGSLEEWRLRLPGGPASGTPQVMNAAYGTPSGAVEVVPTTQDFYYSIDSWHWRVPQVILDAVGEEKVCKVQFGESFARLEGYLAVRYTSGTTGSLPREISVAVKQQVQTLWDLRGAHLVGQDAKPNPMVRQLIRKWNANGLIP